MATNLVDAIKAFREQMNNAGGGSPPTPAAGGGVTPGYVNKQITDSQKTLIKAIRNNAGSVLGKLTGNGKR